MKPTPVFFPAKQPLHRPAGRRCHTLCLLALALLIFPAAIRAEDKTEVLIDQTLGNADPGLQSPPMGSPPYVSVPWHMSSAKEVRVDSEGLVLGSAAPRSFGVAWAYFAPEGAPVELRDGEALRLTFEYSYPQNVGGVINMFRFGLFDTGGGSRDQGSGEIFACPSLRGYAVQANPQNDQDNGAAIYAENNNGAAGRPFTADGGGLYKKEGEDFPSLDAGAKRLTGRMTISRNAGLTTITVDFDTNTPDGAVVREDVEFLDVSQFDAVGFAHQATSQPIRIHRVRVERVAAEGQAN